MSFCAQWVLPRVIVRHFHVLCVVDLAGNLGKISDSFSLEAEEFCMIIFVCLNYVLAYFKPFSSRCFLVLIAPNLIYHTLYISVILLCLLFLNVIYDFISYLLYHRHSSSALDLFSECCGWRGTWWPLYCPLAQQQRTSFHFSNGSLPAAASRQLGASEWMLPGRYKNIWIRH